MNVYKILSFFYHVVGNNKTQAFIHAYNELSEWDFKTNILKFEIKLSGHYIKLYLLTIYKWQTDDLKIIICMKTLLPSMY